VFAAAFLLFGLWPLRRGQSVRPWGLILSAAILGIALIRPSLLQIPNRLWTRLGLVLGKIVNPIVTGLLFFLVFTPFATVFKWMGKDPLGLSIDREAKTYWESPNATERLSDMTRQF
jgi:hypothetical protein